MKPVCPHCQGEHLIFSCEKFKKLTPQGRFEAVKKASLCLNCLRSNHRVMDCTAMMCRKCSKKHNTLLHFERSSSTEFTCSGQTNPVASTSKTLVNMHTSVSSEALLATAIVDLFNPQGKTKTCRVFLDSGSQANFISEDCEFLKIAKKK